jgi:hypothetical protein
MRLVAVRPVVPQPMAIPQEYCWRPREHLVIPFIPVELVARAEQAATKTLVAVALEQWRTVEILQPMEIAADRVVQATPRT